MSKEEKLKSVHSQAMSEFDRIYTAVCKERDQCTEDRRFYSIAGAQWEGRLGEQFENKPRMEFNKIHLSVIRIINEYRKNRISVSFITKDGSEAGDLADKCAGLFRADEQDSNADEAYRNAFEEAVGGGFGAWRLCCDYEDDEDDDNEYQRVRILPIHDADQCVYFDLNSMRQDKSDANHCFVLKAMTKEAYREEFEKEPVEFSQKTNVSEFDWFAPDLIYVAEYYKKEEVKDKVFFYRTAVGDEEKLRESEIKAEPKKEEELLARGFEKVREKKIKCKKVHKYIIDGQEVVEDCGIIAGKYIPIIPVFGKRWVVDGIERMMGHVRLAKDAQRLKNMQLSKLAEISAMSSVEKPILTPEQIVGHQHMWAEDNIKDYPFLLINALKDASGNTLATAPAAYTKSPQIPPAMAALLQTTEQDMSDILGKSEAGDELKANISGEAIGLLQNRLDGLSYIYMDNFAEAMKYAGKVWLSQASDTYVEDERKMKIVNENGDTGMAEIAKPVYNEEEGQIDYETDLSKAKFEVTVDIGATSSSKRAATVKSITNMLTFVQDPETVAVLTYMGIMNMDGEGLGDLQDYFRNKLVQMGAVKPTEEEAQQLAEAAQNQQPDPQALYLQAEAEKSQALAVKAQADTAFTEAKTKDTIAKTAQTLAGIDRDDQKQALETAKAFGNAVTAQQQNNMGESSTGFE